MSIGIGENLGSSFGFAKEKLFGSFVTWLILSIFSLIPIVSWIANGIYLKVFRGEDPTLENLGTSFVQGFLAWLIGLIYMIIPIIVCFILGGAALAPAIVSGTVTAASISAGLGIVSTIITLVVALIFSLIYIPALINYAREQKFGAAFAFGKIFSMIGKAGWLKYIASLILLAIIFGVIGCICGLLCLILIGFILLFFLIPFLSVWGAKYFANLFE